MHGSAAAIKSLRVSESQSRKVSEVVVAAPSAPLSLCASATILPRVKRLALILLFASTLLASEGKWTPQQVLELDPQWLKAAGARAAAGAAVGSEARHGPARGRRSAPADARPAGSRRTGWSSPITTASSACCRSTPRRRTTSSTNGFLARTRDAELRSQHLRITIPRRFTDVTAEVLAAVPEERDAMRSASAPSRRRRTRSWRRARSSPATRCKVAAHDGGLQYVLQEMTELRRRPARLRAAARGRRVRRRDRQLDVAAPHRRLRDRPRVRRRQAVPPGVLLPARHKRREARRLRDGPRLPGHHLSRADRGRRWKSATSGSRRARRLSRLDPHPGEATKGSTEGEHRRRRHCEDPANR